MSDSIKSPKLRGVADVPVVMQLEALECGAACLCMAMAYYGKWVPLEQVRKDCGVSRDGSKASNILKAARNYGFKAKGYRIELKELKSNTPKPCIIFWEFNHYIVLNGFRGNKVYVNDPARGNFSMPVDEFDKGYTGIVLAIEPGDDFMPSGKPKSIMGFARNRLRGAESAMIFVMITTAITSLIGIITAGFSRVFLDDLLTGEQPQWFIPFMTGLGIITLLSLVTAWIQAIYSIKLNGKMAVVGNSTYMWKVLRLPMEFFSQRMAGDIQMRKESNATLAEQIVNNLAPLFINTIMMIFYLFVMIRYSWLLTLIGVLSVLSQFVLSFLISRKRINITRVMMRDRGKLAGATVAGIDVIESIKASGAENGFFEKWSGYQASVSTQNVRFQRLDYYLGIVPSIISGILSTMIVVVGVWMTIKGQFTAGMVMAFQGFLTQFLSPAEKIIASGQQMQEMRSGMERIGDVMEYPEDPAIGSIDGNIMEEGSYSKLGGNLTMKNVTFGYSRLEPPLIEDFSLEMKQGQRIALVGPSGCGKSTLSKLISGLYQPWSGEILIDGKPISNIDRNVFTGSVSVVDQDIILFEDTIANNIKMWDNTIEDFEMIMAARDAQIHDDIMKRDGGYQYKITEGGRDFSGGQRQRLEIARVLAQDPTMVIMDEATSALDARTEFDVVNSIRDRGISCIVIAHRLSTIRDCDEIIVLDRGKVVERGTHDELIANDGMYKKLVTSE